MFIRGQTLFILKKLRDTKICLEYWNTRGAWKRRGTCPSSDIRYGVFLPGLSCEVNFVPRVYKTLRNCHRNWKRLMFIRGQTLFVLKKLRDTKICLEYANTRGAQKHTFCTGRPKTNFLIIFCKIAYKSLLINVLLLSRAPQPIYSWKISEFNTWIQIGCEN